MIANINVLAIFLFCVGVYVFVGLLGAFCVVFAQKRSKKSFRDFIMRTIPDNTKMPFFITATIYFAIAIFAWPFVFIGE